MSTNGANPEQQATAAALAAAAASDEREKPDAERGIQVLSNGIRIRIKAVPPQAIRDAIAAIPVPEVPTTFVESKGREEENPNDPDYQKAVAATEEAQALASQRVAMVLGTELIDVPEGMQRPEDDGWIEDAEWLQLEVPRDDRRARYCAWLRYYAIQTHEDLAKTQSAPLLLASLSEEEVDQAVDTFRRRTPRRADNVGLPVAPDTDGDRVPDDGGDDSGDRGTGSGTVRDVPVDRVVEPSAP